MKVIGITGTTGTGKTTVSKIIGEEIKGQIINADEVVKKLSEKGEKYYLSIVKNFGIEILDKNENIDRKFLAHLIYNDEKSREKINKITNRYVLPEIKREVRNIKTQNTVILDVPLLFESQLSEICSITIAILADEKIKIERICKRDNISIETAKKRLSIQENDKFYREKADYIIENNEGDMKNLRKNIKKVLKEMSMNVPNDRHRQH